MSDEEEKEEKVKGRNRKNTNAETGMDSNYY